MAWKVRLIGGAILMCLFIALYTQTYLPVPRGYQSEQRGTLKNGGSDNRKEKPNKVEALKNGNKNLQEDALAIIVPFRDRFEELQEFVPYIHSFLNRQTVKHFIYVVNQVDAFRFNRAALINVGYKHAKNQTNYMVMHDVDLLPLNNQLSYKKPEEGHVKHIAAPGLHPKYEYPTFIGGILIISNHDFASVNGMSNIYWGWGLEDDEFYVRLKQGKITVVRPTVSTDKTSTFRHIHSTRPRDTKKCYDQYNRSRKRDRLTGLNNVNYTLVSSTNMLIEDTPFTVLNVKLKCDVKISPWCDCSSKQRNSSNAKA